MNLEVIEKLKKLGTAKRFAKGEFICYEGDVGTEMFIILSGQVAVYGNSFGCVQEKFAVLGKGEFFGEMSMLDNLPRSASGVAETDVVVLSIPRENFQRLIREVPEMAFAIMTTLSRRIRQLEARLLEACELTPAGTAAASQGVSSSPETVALLLEGHKVYGLRAPETHQQYLFEKMVTCPVCGLEFATKIPRMTRLKLNRRDYDLREVYADFEPLWYTIRTCPGCLYSENYNDFDRLSKASEDKLGPYREKARRLQGQVSLLPADPLSVDRVFLSYYLALYFAEVEGNPLDLGKLYLALSWLYRDVGDEEMYERSWRLAFDNFYQAYYGTTNLRLKPEQEQQNCLVLGELYLRQGDLSEALRHFYAAIRNQDGIPFYNNLARDRYMEVKEMRR